MSHPTVVDDQRLGIEPDRAAIVARTSQSRPSKLAILDNHCQAKSGAMPITKPIFQRNIRSAVWRLLCICSILVLVLNAPNIAHASDEWVTTEPSINGYLVRGGAIHHSSYEKDRTEAASCDNCFWQINAICESWEDETRGWCPSMRLRCPADLQIVEVFRANAKSQPPLQSGLWRRTGYSCIGTEGPAATGQIINRISARQFISLPALKFQTFPPVKTLVNLPTRVVFQSPNQLPDRKIQVAGIDVTFRAAASRSISCTGCSRISNRTVYWQRPGIVQITGTAVWQASFDALGIKGIPITQPYPNQKVESTLSVFQLNRKLVGTNS